jgi:glycerate dehydrogenase
MVKNNLKKEAARVKIVVLDGHGLNPGDLDWGIFEKFGEVTVYDRTSYDDPQEILRRIGDAEIVLDNKVPLDKKILAKLPKVRYIGVTATGYNIIDLAAAKAQGITVTNIPAYGTYAVAQFTFALLLEIANQVGLHNDAVHAGEWASSPDFTFWKRSLIELSGKTMGLVGYGRIAQAVAGIALAMGMKVIFYNHRPKTDLPAGVTQVDLDTLYAQADIISLHVPQTPETTAMINQTAIQKMQDGVILINTARGGLIDEQAVADALNTGKIYAAGVDVVSEEPILPDNPLLQAKNCYITPHIAWAPTETRQRLLDIALDNLDNYLKETPRNVVS